MHYGTDKTLPPAFYDEVRFLKGVGPRREKTLNKLGIHTVGDLLLTLPRDYQRYQVVAAADAREGERVALSVMIKHLQLRPMRRGRGIVEASAADSTGTVQITWFNQPYVMEKITAGMWLLVEGKMRRSKRGIHLEPSRWEVIDEEEGGFLLGSSRREFIRVIYPLTEGISQRMMRDLVRKALSRIVPDMADPIPEDLLKKHNFPDLPTAFRLVHSPETLEEAELGRRRLAYQEFLLFQTAMALRREHLRSIPADFVINVPDKVDERIRRRIPFPLTAAQERVISEIREDMGGGGSMNRLLQGDVGTGKTIVAFYSVLACVAAKLQAAVLAPTEILAEQHFRLFQNLLKGSRVRLELLTSSVKGRKREETLKGLEDGSVNVLIGTHAVIESGVSFKHLALAVMDEQHRFGVLERKRLRSKGTGLHTLLMTATPIPRTLALTLYGDLDVSVLDEFPPGRGKVTSRQVDEADEDKMWQFIRNRAEKGERVYVICPLIEESEKSDLVAAEQLYGELRKSPLKNVGIGLLHGRMKWRDKDKVVADLRSGRLRILVSTVVVEVGIDVPEATVMVVQHAERFGLSQLHQLRGRVGRGSRDSWFFMLRRGGDETTQKRIEVLEKTRDGFAVAEEDFKLRGSGEFFGTRQHGESEFIVADLNRDFDLLMDARRDARALVREDPGLSASPHLALKQRIMEVFRGRINLADVG